MSEELFVPDVVTAAGLAVSKYTGPETPFGQTRTRVQLSQLGAAHGERKITTFSVDEWLALGVAIQATAWERPVLPICYDSRCQHTRPPHGRWPDCPERDDG
jgi:hypothetical protein